jgi:stearoyl-CoA desaturase (delta-9 desaturase)
MAPRDPDRVDWRGTGPFLALHALALATPWLAPPTAGLVSLAAALYAVRMLGLAVGYHRGLSHGAYRARRGTQLVLAWLGCAAAQRGPLWWASHDRAHHRAADQPRDLRSPHRRGLAFAHVGWLFAPRAGRVDLERVGDLAAQPELAWLERHWLVPPATLALGLLLLGGPPAVLWGFVVSTVLLWHGSLLVNSLGHLAGRRRYETGDESRNGLLLSLLTLGEGWHNNHHFYAASARQGWFWWELDPSWLVLRALAALGLVSDLKTPPARVRLAHLRTAHLDRRLAPTGRSPGGAA